MFYLENRAAFRSDHSYRCLNLGGRWHKVTDVLNITSITEQSSIRNAPDARRVNQMLGTIFPVFYLDCQ